MKKRTVALILALVMSLSVFAACSTKAPVTSEPTESSGQPLQSQSNPQTPTSNTKPVDVEFWTFQDLHVKFYETMAGKWNAEHPDESINLIPTVYPFDDMHNKLLIALQSGVGAPDLVDIEIGKFANFLKGDVQLVPLNDIVEPELDNIVRTKAVDIYRKDGNFYGIDFAIGAAVMYYNTELCDQAGVNWQDIKTWDEYYEAGKKFKTAMSDKYWGSMETSDIWHMWPMLSSQGSDMLDDDGKPNIASPEMERVLTYNRKLVDEGLGVLAPGNYHHSEEFYALMNSGAIASMVMPMWYMDRFTDHMPDLKQKMMISPLPVWEVGQPRSVGMGGTGTAISNQSKNIELVKKFFAYARFSVEGNIQVWNLLGFEPIRTEVWTMPEVVNATNKFTEFFLVNPFDVLNELEKEILAVNVDEALPSTLDAMKTYVLYRAYTEVNPDIKAILAEEQSKIQY